MIVARNASRILRSALRRKTASITTFHANVDHLSSSKKEHEEAVAIHPILFSNSMSFASPESDFCSSRPLIIAQYSDFDFGHEEENEKAQSADMEDSGTHTFSSPEGDFSFVHNDNTHLESEGSSYIEWSNSLSFSSPESDFSTSFPTPQKIVTQEHRNMTPTEEAKEKFFHELEKNSIDRNGIAYSLSYASAEADFFNPEFLGMLNERQKKQLANTSLLVQLPNHDNTKQFGSVVNQHEVVIPTAEQNHLEYQELRAHANLLKHEDPLPMNMQEASMEDDARAIVITETQVPFRIVNVNSAWENLCGFTKDECNGQTLNCIQGPETNQAAITALMAQLLRGEQAGTVLVNYRKDGSKFLNRLRVGAMRDDSNAVTHFVAVLKEVKEMEDHFNEGSRILV